MERPKRFLSGVNDRQTLELPNRQLLTSHGVREKVEKIIEKRPHFTLGLPGELEDTRRKPEEKTRFLYKLFDAVKAGLILIDAQTQRITEINHLGCEIIGASREELLGKICYETYCPAERGRCPVKDLGQKLNNTEWIIIGTNGEEIPVLESVEPIELDGKLFYLHSFVDLREQKCLEKSLKEQGQKMSAIAESARDAIVMLDGDGKISFWNPSAAQMFGYTAEETIGKDLHKLLAPSIYFESFQQAFPKFKETGTGDAIGKTLELSAVRKDGSEIPVELSLSAFQINGKWHSTGIIRDISERKKIEETLIKSERFLESMFDAIQDGISVLDPDLNIMKVNQRMQQWYNENVPLEGKKCYEAYQNRKTPCEICPTIRAIKSGKTEREIVPGLPGSSVEWLELFTYPIIDPSGAVTAVVEFVRDISEIRQAEEALRKSELMHRSLIESTSDPIVHLDKYRRVVTCNKSFSDVFGYKKEELLGKSIMLIHESEESFRAFGKLAYPAVARKGTAKTEWKFVTKTGQKIPFETTTSAIKDSSGNIVGYVSIMRDSTERKKAEQSLRESEEKYRMVVENLKEGIVVGQDGMLKFVNSAVCKITGYTEEELLSIPWIQLVHPDDRQKAIQNHTKRLSRKHPPKAYLMRVIDKHGTTRWLENNGVVIEWEGKPAILNFLMDVTERKLAEDEFRRAHSELENLIKSLSSILIELSPALFVKRWNRIAEQTFGLNEKQVMGRRLKDLPIDWELDPISDALGMCLREKSTAKLQDIVFSRPDGTRGFLGLTITPKIDDDGHLKGFIIMASDITERRALETQLLQAQKLESVGQLAAGVAHEINTPTQFVGDNIQFLQESFKDLSYLLKSYQSFIQSIEASEKLPKEIQRIKDIEKEIDVEYLMDEIPKAIEQSLEGIKRVAKIVRAMKEFSHPGNEEKTPTDLNHAIDNTVTVAKNEWKYVADLETDFDPALPLVPCLPGELNQVILNMIINAAHAISEVVEKQGGGKGKIKITTRKDGDWVEIRISDTGPGIPEAIRGRIFDPFFTTKEVGKGTGQGLAISRSVIVDKHGGTIDLETTEGEGTTFIIRLPLEDKTP